MLGLVHTLLLWSYHVRQASKRPTQLSMFVLALSVLAWSLVHQSQSVPTQQLFTTLLAIGYAYYQRSLWALTLIPITLSTTVEFHAWVDGLLQTLHANTLSILLQTDVSGTTVQWQGVSVHVGPSCVNLLMFQGAAAIGWLAAQRPSLCELSRTIGVLVGFAGGLNFVRILALTLLAPLAPNEDTWFLIHDGISLAASLILVVFIWHRLKRQSIPSASSMPLHTKSQ